MQMGHCLKEMDLFAAAECSYRSALLLGAPLEDVAEHLLFTAEYCGAPETLEAICALNEAIGKRDPPACSLPTLVEILSFAEANGTVSRLSAETCAQWMRMRISRVEIEAAIAGGGQGGYQSGGEARALRGFPATTSPSFDAADVWLWLSRKWKQRFSPRQITSASPELAEWFATLDNLKLAPDSAVNNAQHSDGVPPELSIVIVNFNKAHLTLKSVKSVLAAAITVHFEIIVVDNGSEQLDYEILKDATQTFRLLRVEQNVFFGPGCNKGAEAALGEFILFLNNDAFLPPGTVESLLEAFAEKPDCGAAGPVFYYPDGRLQEAGASVNADGLPRQRGKGDPWFRVEALPRFDVVDYVSGACLMMRRSMFHELGGFDGLYAPAYYEDTDLCFKLTTHDLKVYLATHAKCVHIEGVSSAGLPSFDSLRVRTAVQRKRFVSRWGKILRERTERSGVLE